MEQKIHALVIEDDPDFSYLVSFHLQEASNDESAFSMAVARTMEEAAAALNASRFSVILLDLMLPDSKGIASVERARALAGETPIIVLTNMSDESLGLQALSGGAHDFLLKEKLEPRTLRRAISYALHRQTLRRLEQVEAEIAERRRIESFKDKVLSIVSHELRSPLAVTKAALANLCDGLAGELSVEQHQLAYIAGRNLERLGRIISNFLDLSRLESGRAKVNRMKFDALRLISEMVAAARIADRSERLLYTVDAPAHLPPAFGDPDLFVQLLQNLFDNAARYAKRRVKVVATAAQGELRVSVTDDGPGISQNQAGQLFQRFVQLDRPSGGQGYKGTGLGLAICQQICRLNEGRVWLDPAGGPGARFHFSVPLWSEERHEKGKKDKSAHRR